MKPAMLAVVEPHLKKNAPAIKPGDTVRVHQIVKEGAKERIQVFEGVVIARKGGVGISATFTVRKMSFGVGVERTFPLHSPRVVKVERVKSAQVRRAKLYYLRGLTGKATRLNGEKVDRAVWEEKGAEDKIEAIEEAVAEEAEARAEEKAEEEGDVELAKPEKLTDEAKAALAAGEEPAVVEEAKKNGETAEEVAHNEEVAKSEA